MMPAKPKHGGAGCRRELKYLVSESQAEAITRFVEPILGLDSFGREYRDGIYPITSLYLDSGDLKLFRESMEGKKNRFKLRVRAYNDDRASAVFLEIKRRVDSVIIKSRTRIDRRHLDTLIAGNLAAIYPNSDLETLNQFQLYLHSLSAKPSVSIRYHRLAFENDSGNRVRVTFDRNLAARHPHPAEVRFGGPGWFRVPVPGVILEVKFTGCYPRWLDRMIKCFGLRARSLSKYTYSIRQSGLLGFGARPADIFGLRSSLGEVR